MSVIDFESSLSLVRKSAYASCFSLEGQEGLVAIVTHASTPLGATVCRTYLRHNCLVLGIDTTEIHPSLNSRVGTHMQYLRCSGWDGLAPDVSTEEVLQACRKKFDGREGVDFLVLLEGETLPTRGWDFVRGISDEMKRTERHGLVMGVASDATGQHHLKDMAENFAEDGIRFNNVTTKAISGSSDISIFKTEAYKDVQNLKGASDSTDELVRARGIANLLLFLASKDCESLGGMIVDVDGSCQPL